MCKFKDTQLGIMKNEITPENDPREYVGYDLYGFPYNCKYPPNKELYGCSHEGYSNKARGVLLYDFAVMGYDVEFSYKGKRYYLLNDGEAYLSDKDYAAKLKAFENPMELIEKLEIDGTRLIDLLDQLDDAEPM